EGVGDGVGHHVGVAVAGQPALVLKGHPAKHKDAARVVHERVHVKADPNPAGHARALSRASATMRSSGSVIFRLLRSPSTTTTAPSHARRPVSNDQSRTRRPSNGSNCLGPPKRSPRPAATTTAHTEPTKGLRQGFVELLLGLFLADPDGEGELGDENLPSPV